MIRSAQNLKVRDVLCVLRFVRVVDLSMSHHGGRDECGIVYVYWRAWVAVVSDAYRCLRRCRPHVSIDNLPNHYYIATSLIPTVSTD